MENIKINTIEKLSNQLKKFDKKLPVAIFDVNRGYMSVAFKKEQTKKNGNVFQWLSLYAHETIQMYDIETLLGYLSKLPPQATILKKTEEDIFTSLYLSIDGMKEKGKSFQWLVISDELEYDRFFRKHSDQTSNQDLEKALEKMAQEMEKETSEQIKRLHQYLCKQTDQKLFKGILTDGKTIKGSLTYCFDNARKLAKNDRFAMVEDETVFQWVKDYFISYELPKKIEKKKPTPKKKENKVKKEPVNKVAPKTQETVTNEKGGSEQQIDLFATI